MEVRERLRHVRFWISTTFGSSLFLLLIVGAAIVTLWSAFW